MPTRTEGDMGRKKPLESEDHGVIQKGKNYVVADYEHYLVGITLCWA